MPENLIFNISESLRNIRWLPRQSIRYLITLALNHLLLVLFFIFCININYLDQVFAVNVFPLSLNTLLIPILYKYNGLRLILFFLLIILLFSLIFTNKKYVKKYMNFNKNEIELIKKLKGNMALVTRPIIITAFFINLTSLILILNYTKLFYSYIFKITVEKTHLFTLLNFDYFNISLFLFLFLITSIVLILTCYFLFWDFKNSVS